MKKHRIHESKKIKAQGNNKAFLFYKITLILDIVCYKNSYPVTQRKRVATLTFCDTSN